jgi:cbb3-type cytochrome oxidase subunit 3
MIAAAINWLAPIALVLIGAVTFVVGPHDRKAIDHAAVALVATGLGFLWLTQ